MRRSFHGIDALLAIAAASLATLSGAKVFDAWEQVIVLWDAELGPLALVGHPHMLRYMVAYPGFLMEESFPGIGFSLYVGIFFGFNVLLLRLISQLGAARSPSLVVYMLFIGAHLTMNGRGAIAWTGWLLCVWVCLKVAAGIARPGSQIGWVALSCALAAVSTGVYIVSVVAFGVFMVAHWRATRRSNWFRRLLAFAIAVPLVYALLDYFIVAIEKNVEFYGGGIEGVFNMLEHGVGVVLVDSGPMAIVLLGIVALVGMVLSMLTVYGRPLTPLERLIGLAVAGGLFGFTVLTLAIPPILVRSLVKSRRGSGRTRARPVHGRSMA